MHILLCDYYIIIYVIIMLLFILLLCDYYIIIYVIHKVIFSLNVRTYKMFSIGQW